MNRRKFITGTGSVLFAGVAGCLDAPSSGNPGGYIRPDDDPEAVPGELVCEEGDYSRFPQQFEEEGVRWGDTENFELRVEKQSYEYGDTIQISLTLSADGSHTTGSPAKYNIQVKTDSGWEDVRVAAEADSIYYNEMGIVHGPDSFAGFNWDIEFTEEGIIEFSESPNKDQFKVCPDLESGRYRFAFWGIVSGDEAVAVAFDIVR